MGEDRVRGADRPSNRERVLVARRSVRTGLIISFLALAALVRVWGLRFGLPHTECRPDESVIVDAPHFHLVARGLTALLGTATVLAVYRLARAAMGHDTGLVAAFFLSLT